ncbi:MAG: hypothetical protein ABH950_03445 [Candidatus Altiarchaeota archaeon]
MTDKREKKESEKVKVEIKPLEVNWKNVLAQDYKEYFATQVDLTTSIRGDDFVHLTFYEESVKPTFGEKKNEAVIERVIKTRLKIPNKAFVRIVKFLSQIIEKPQEQPEEKYTTQSSEEADTSYIR